MLTTQALIDAALARGLELPGEWFAYHCKACPCAYPRRPNSICPMCGTIRLVVKGEQPTYIGPDLTAPANLYELMRFADAVGDEPINKFPVSIEWDVDASAYKTHVGGRIGTGPDRTTAVIAACAKSLGLEGHNQ